MDLKKILKKICCKFQKLRPYWHCYMKIEPHGHPLKFQILTNVPRHWNYPYKNLVFIEQRRVKHFQDLLKCEVTSKNLKRKICERFFSLSILEEVSYQSPPPPHTTCATTTAIVTIFWYTNKFSSQHMESFSSTITRFLNFPSSWKSCFDQRYTSVVQDLWVFSGAWKLN
jgi:hypothetical protein